MRVTNIVMGAVVTLGLMAGIVATTPQAFAKKDTHKVTICHATASHSNPYVVNTVDYHSIVKNNGHDQHQGGRDIIPAMPERGYPGKNLANLHILNNGCEVAGTETADTPAQPSPRTPEKPVNKPSKKNTQHKYTICHATRSATNPYRAITVDYNSIVKRGHGNHSEPATGSYADARAVKSAGEHWGDVVPAMPAHDYAGLNLDKTGRELLRNNCRVDAPTARLVVAKKSVESSTPEKTRIDSLAAQPEAAEETFQTVDALPVTGITTAPLLILLAGALTAGAFYLAPYLRKSTEQ